MSHILLACTHFTQKGWAIEIEIYDSGAQQLDH